MDKHIKIVSVLFAVLGLALAVLFYHVQAALHYMGEDVTWAFWGFSIFSVTILFGGAFYLWRIASTMKR